MLISELQINHPASIGSVITACKTGPASNILAGLSFGYLGNIPPIIVWASLSFLSYFWLGGFGASLMAVGVALLIPNSLAANTYFSSIENASFISYVGQLGDESIGNLMSICENRRLY
jgi:K(+)-stimulated pyrophosphate-energized sodium pump